MLRDYLKKTNISNFPDNEIESIINDYLNMSTDTNLKRVTDKLDKINLVMPVKFENDEIKEIVLSESDDHNLYMTLFTSINEYEKYEKEETGYMVDTLANIASILTKPGNKAQGLIIDPYGINLMLSKDVIIFKNTELYKILVFVFYITFVNKSNIEGCRGTPLPLRTILCNYQRIMFFLLRFICQCDTINKKRGFGMIKIMFVCHGKNLTT